MHVDDVCVVDWSFFFVCLDQQEQSWTKCLLSVKIFKNLIYKVSVEEENKIMHQLYRKDIWNKTVV